MTEKKESKMDDETLVSRVFQFINHFGGGHHFFEA